MTDADCKVPLARIALIAALTFGFAAAGAAQEIPEGQSCGGLVCDLGLFGHKTAPKAAPSVPVPAAASPVPPPARTAATPETDARRPARKRAHVVKAPVAKAVPKPATASATAAFGAPPVASSLMPAAPGPAAPAPVASAPALPPAFAAAPPPAPIPVTATPARDEPVVLSNPYVYNRPLKFMFQSVDPSQGVQ